jgi:hypothetical protein
LFLEVGNIYMKSLICITNDLGLLDIKATLT